jgi:alkanesulfonate monooxygenase SsuD/methylene tetrahydromethanopterin reductase-like flavin-dependent oxidoreductase (luciferase family)
MTTGFGLTSAVPPRVAGRIAAEAEALGYESVWVNEVGPPEGWRRVLSACARATNHLQLGVGVLAVDRESVDALARKVDRLEIPADRLTLAFGSGDSSSVDLVRKSVMAAKLSIAARIGIGALGPRMCELAGEVGDVVLLNWLTLDALPRSLSWIESGARRASRPMPRIAAYVRVAMGPEARLAIADDASKYLEYAAYKRHFSRLSIDPASACLAAEDEAKVAAGLSGWRAVIDEPVVRWLPASSSFPELLDRVRTSAPSDR